eukprot:CAMPEP_0197918500 /NCGR_PEP_ID=MMETSP1439-20131203/85565_1 /TAXON_ID=66791 /ORGANISM="Gonyaulax spinifera, Strain CCMP409" /LENGTH=186 /DNA_ID=CAMNT_0043540619 /DNA_START=253 /DNA_END=811 /DNA_ORIENTATION=+
MVVPADHANVAELAVQGAPGLQDPAGRALALAGGRHELAGLDGPAGAARVGLQDAGVHAGAPQQGLRRRHGCDDPPRDVERIEEPGNPEDEHQPHSQDHAQHDERAVPVGADEDAPPPESDDEDPAEPDVSAALPGDALLLDKDARAEAAVLLDEASSSSSWASTAGAASESSCMPTTSGCSIGEP